MTSSNQELLNKLSEFTLGDNDPHRTQHFNMLRAICAGYSFIDSKASGNLGPFINNANKFLKVPSDKSIEELLSNSKLSASVLRKEALRQLELLKSEDKLKKIKADSATKDECKWLEGVANSKVGGVFHDLDLNVDQEMMNVLVEPAKKKLDESEASRKEKFEKCNKDIDTLLETQQELVGNPDKSVTRTLSQFNRPINIGNESVNSINSAIDLFEGRAQGKIDSVLTDLKKGRASVNSWKFSINKHVFRGKVKSQEQEEDVKKLEEKLKKLDASKLSLKDLRNQIKQIKSRLVKHNNELTNLKNKLEAKKRQINGTETISNLIEKGKDFPIDAKIESGHFYYKAPENKLPENKVFCEVKLRSLQDQNSIINEKIEIIDGRGSEVDQIKAYLLEKEMIVKKYDVFQIDKDIASIKKISLDIEHIQADMDEANRLVKRFKQENYPTNPVEPNPAPSTSYVMRIGDSDSPFKEEIVPCREDAQSLTQPYGLAGHTIYRGIRLDKNQMKRATRETDQGKIVIESSVHKNEKGQPVMKVVDRTVKPEKISEDDQIVAAYQFASELLLAYKPGDKITLDGGEQCAPLAERVYAALLDLTKLDSKDQSTPPFDPSCIVIKVPGVKQANLITKGLAYVRTNDWRDAFIARSKIKDVDSTLFKSEKYKKEVQKTRQEVYDAKAKDELTEKSEFTTPKF